jgi:hypothetical protein
MLYFPYRYTHKDIVVIVDAQVTTAKTRKEVSIILLVGVSLCTSPRKAPTRKRVPTIPARDDGWLTCPRQFDH